MLLVPFQWIRDGLVLCYFGPGCKFRLPQCGIHTPDVIIISIIIIIIIIVIVMVMTMVMVTPRAVKC